jgi:uncharacterized membrane protein YeiH
MTHLLVVGVQAANVDWGSSWKLIRNFTALDLIAAGTTALNGALPACRPDHDRNFTVGVLQMGLLMVLGGGMTRDVLV